MSSSKWQKIIKVRVLGTGLNKILVNSKEPRKRVSRKTASVGERDEKGHRTVGWYYVRKDAKKRKGKRR